MKKSIKAFAMLLTTLFFLFGCGGTKSSSYLLKNEMAQTTTTVEHKGDTVTKITILNEWNLKAMGPNFSKQSAESLAQATLSLYTDIPGITSSTSSTDEKITFTITIDLEKVDFSLTTSLSKAISSVSKNSKKLYSMLDILLNNRLERYKIQ